MNRGGWLKSASRLRKKSYPWSMANRIPARIAVPSPSLPARWMTWTSAGAALQIVGDRARAVGRVVVDDQDRRVGRRRRRIASTSGRRLPASL